MTSLRFQNVYITQLFHRIDQKRAPLKMECVLPLTGREKMSYVEISRLHLVSHEYTRLFEKGIFLLISTLHLCGILLADYFLFWLLSIAEFDENNGHAIESKGESHASLYLYSYKFKLFSFRKFRSFPSISQEMTPSLRCVEISLAYSSRL